MTPVLAVRGVRVRRGLREILRDVSFTASAGDVVALMGLSGSGKTTALRAVAGLDPFDAGEIRVGEMTRGPGPVPRDHGRRHVGMVFQFHHLFE
ncbi:MAG TPA: ATP-binding cassette domain-containing protein, partial [Vicinamibacterales bacterium]